MKDNNCVKIIIGGDFFPGRGTENFVKNNPKFIWGDTLELFKRNDFRIINLEAPVTESVQKIDKTGPHLKVPFGTLKSLQAADINIVTLSNNHIRDFGDQGVIDTIENLSKLNIKHVGAGANITDANKILYLTKNKKNIAIINVSENEWSTATDSNAGANPINEIDVVYAINDAKKNADIVLLIIHGGHEHYQLPSPELVKRYRFFADMGANAIICHHTHCFNGYEVYNSVPIFYGLGNLFFPNKTGLNTSSEGFLLELTINYDNSLSYILHPYFQILNKEKPQIEFMNDQAKVVFLSKIKTLNLIIENKDKLNEEWSKFVKRKKEHVFSLFISPSFLLYRIINKLKFSKYFNNKKLTNYRLNQIRCESHLELTKSVFSIHLKE